MTTFDAVEPDRALEALARVDLRQQSLSQTLLEIAELAAQTIPDVDDASITVVDERGRAKTVVFTSPLAVELDERQYASGFGPCLDAAATGDTIVLDHRDGSPLYPAFTEVALRAGVLHSAAVALQVPYRTAGALNLYSRRVAPFSVEAMGFAERFASYAAYAVSNADHVDDVELIARQLQEAMRSRAIIEQAKGILMARHCISADEAFRRLATTSQNTNTRLRELAAEMVAAPGSAD